MGGGILFISPYPGDAGILIEMLHPISLELEHVACLREACVSLSRRTYGVILTEAQLQDGNWVDVLNLANDLALPSAVIVTHRLADERLWAEVLNLGAYDLLVQPFDAGEVQRILTSASLRSLQKPVGSETKAEGKISRAAL